MATPTVKKLLAGAAITLIAAGCAHSAPPAAVGPQAASVRTSSAERADIEPVKRLGRINIEDRTIEITPEKAEDAARARATAWQADAELRFVGWGVLKWELLSAVSHVFYSPSADQVLVVKTFLRDKWQDADAYDHAIVTKPAEVLQPLTGYKIDGHRALKLARRHFSFWNKRPVSLVTLSHPPKLPFAFWGVVADATVVLVHANTGQSLSPRGVDPFPKEWTK